MKKKPSGGDKGQVGGRPCTVVRRVLDSRQKGREGRGGNARILYLVRFEDGSERKVSAGAIEITQPHHKNPR